jgi:hypothetical protein
MTEMDPMVSVDRLNKLAEVIEERPDQFDMNWWWKVPKDDEFSNASGHFNVNTPADMEEHYQVDMLAPGCGTRACVAGWACSLWSADIPTEHRHLDAAAGAQDVLGIDHETSNWLFDADAQHKEAHEAAEVLRDIAAWVTVHGTSEGFVAAWQGDHWDDGY